MINRFLCLFLSTIIYITPSYARDYILREDFFTYLFPVNEPVHMTNPFLWPISTTCLVTSPNISNKISIQALRKSGTFNGIYLSKGDKIELTLYSQDKIQITAAPGAEVEMINKGEQLITAQCN